MSFNRTGEEKNPYVRANSLDQLLEWHDANFVRCAYVTVLGRQPDFTGEQHYVGRLRSGRSRLQILQDLRSSSEAARHDPGIAGLDRAIRMAALQRLPLIGAVIGWFSVNPDARHGRDRQSQALLNAIFANQTAISSLEAQVRILESQLRQRASDDVQHTEVTANRHAGNPPPTAAGTPPELEGHQLSNPLARHFAEKVA